MKTKEDLAREYSIEQVQNSSTSTISIFNKDKYLGFLAGYNSRQSEIDELKDEALKWSIRLGNYMDKYKSLLEQLQYNLKKINYEK